MAAASSYFDQVQKIYTAFYQRPADSGGLLFWSQMAAVNGGDLGKVINAFASSAEATTLYGSITAANVGDVVDSIYKALFGRVADAAGKKFYVDGFAAGTFTAGKIAMDILNGAQNSDLIAINNKAAAANVFTAAVDGRAMTDAAFGTGSSFAATYSGNADVTAARTWLAAIGADPSTVPSTAAVIGSIQAIIANTGDAILNMQGNLTLTASPTVPDNLTGTSANDVFLARTSNNANTLQDGDRIDGGGGADTLYADMTGTGVAITPIFTNLENVVIRAQSTTADPINGNNMTNRPVQIDAQRSLGVDVADHVTAATGVTRWESNNSRSDVIIEDVRIGNNQKTKDITVAMVETDPGNVDYGVYFNQQSLRNSGTSTGEIRIFLMDTQSVRAATVSGISAVGTEVANHAFNTFKFNTVGQGLLVLGAGTTQGTVANNAASLGNNLDFARGYIDLEIRFNEALAGTYVPGSSSVRMSDVYELTKVENAPFYDVLMAAGKTVEAAPFQANNLKGTYFILKLKPGADPSYTPVDVGAEWAYAGQAQAPADGSIAQAITGAQTSTTELVTSKVILDDVGLGSTGGDLVIGGMSVGETSTSRGVERFEIEVRDNSKLQTINGTNNALREVVIVNGATSRTVADAYTTTVKDAGNLTVNGNVNITSLGTGTPANTGNDTILKGVNDANAINGYTADHHGAFGFTDVRLIDGSAMKGRLAFTAQITQDSIRKYIDLVDTQNDPAGDVARSGNEINKKGADFIYTGGGNDDALMVAIDTTLAGSRSRVVTGQSDFTFSVEGGAGNDAITVNMTTDPGRVGNAQNWYNNQDLNNNITVSGGAGNDVIRTPGAGDKNILGGSGNDWIYSDNSGAQVVTTTGTAAVTAGTQGVPGAVSGVNGMWIFNTTDQVAASAGLAARNINDVRSDVNSTYNFFNTKLTVTFKGIPSAAITIPSTGYRTSDLQINQAIKYAINTNDTLKALLVAEDGPANSLIIKSLVDGVMVPADLGIALTFPVAAAAAAANPVAMTLSQTDITGAATAYSTTAAPVAATETAVLAIAGAGGTASAAYAAKGDYSTVMATDGAVNVTGAASVSTTDNLITPGTGNDIIVLSTTLGATTAASSNETIKFEPGFGDDVILNFSPAGAGIDHLDFTALSGVTFTAAYTTDMSINVETAVVVPAGSTIEQVIAAKFNANNTTAQKHVFVNVSAHNVGTVYTIDDPVGANTATATRQGSIDLADASWLTGGLTAASFVNSSAAGSAQTDGPSGSGSTTTPTPTYAVAAGATSNNEGSNATFTVTTTNVANGTVLNYTLSGTGITIADITGATALTGTVTINNNTGTITVPLAADVTTEGNETLVVTVNGQTASTTIADTSTASAFTNVDLSTGTVAGTAAAEAFVYDYKMVSGRPTKAGDGEVTITGFDTTKDKLVFNDVGTGTVYTKAQFFALAGVVVADDPFSGNASVYVDPDNGVSGGVTLTGVVTTAVPVETLA